MRLGLGQGPGYAVWLQQSLDSAVDEAAILTTPALPGPVRVRSIFAHDVPASGDGGYIFFASPHFIPRTAGSRDATRRLVPPGLVLFSSLGQAGILATGPRGFGGRYVEIPLAVEVPWSPVFFGFWEYWGAGFTITNTSAIFGVEYL